MKIYLIIFLLFYTVGYAGQLEELINFAKENSPKLKEFEKLENITKFQENYSLTLQNPKVVFGFNNFELNKPYLSSNNPMGSFSIGISQEYTPLIKREIESQIFLKERQIIKINKEIFERQLKRQIKESYGDFIFTFRKEDILNQQLNIYEKYKKLFEENYKYGKSGLKDILSLNIKILEIKKNLEEINKEREILKNKIFYLIGGEFPLKDDKDFENQNFEDKNISESIYIKQFDFIFEKVDKEIEKAKAETLPNFEFMGEYMYRNGFPDMITLKVGIQIPIFKSKKENLLILQKREEKLIKQLQLENEKLRIQNVVLSSKTAYEKNLKMIKLYEEILNEKNNLIKAIEIGIKYNKAESSELLKVLDEILQINLEILNLKLENFKLKYQIEEVL